MRRVFDLAGFLLGALVSALAAGLQFAVHHINILTVLNVLTCFYCLVQLRRRLAEAEKA